MQDLFDLAEENHLSTLNTMKILLETAPATFKSQQGMHRNYTVFLSEKQ